MKKRITLTEKHLALIPFINFEEEDNGDLIVTKNHVFNLGDHLLEDMALILGFQDEVVKGTENDVDGAAYSDEATEMMLELHKYIVDNLYYIETMIHQFSTEGGLTVGTYVCDPKDLIWQKEA